MAAAGIACITDALREGLYTKFTVTIKIRWAVSLLGLGLLCLRVPGMDQETLVLCVIPTRVRGQS